MHVSRNICTYGMVHKHLSLESWWGHSHTVAEHFDRRVEDGRDDAGEYSRAHGHDCALCASIHTCYLCTTAQLTFLTTRPGQCLQPAAAATD